MTAEDVPDDVATWMLLRFGTEWIDALPAYRSLAESRGVPLARVLTAASHDRLREIVDLEVTSAL